MEGWWCVRHGDALAWVEAPSEAAAVRRSLGLHRLGDWTADARELVVFPQDVYPENAGPHDYTRVVLSAGHASVGPLRNRGPRMRRDVRRPPRVALPDSQLLQDATRLGQPCLFSWQSSLRSPLGHSFRGSCRSPEATRSGLRLGRFGSTASGTAAFRVPPMTTRCVSTAYRAPPPRALVIPK